MNSWRGGASSLHRCVFVALLAAMMLASGCVISPRRIVGGGATPTPTPGGSPTPTPGTTAETLYVSDSSTNSILRFSNAAVATGNASPAVLSGAATQLNSPQHIFIDEPNNRLYVANQGTGSVLVWDAASTKSGPAAPNRTISGLATNLLSPVDVAVDTGKDLLYVADGRDVFVFSGASTANGSPPPLHDIQVGFVIGGMYLDATNDRLFLTDPGANQVNVFNNASTLNLTVAPSRSIFGSATLLNQPTGVAVDSVNKLIVSNAGNNSITVYVNAAAVNNNAPSSITLQGANTTLNVPHQIAVNKTSPVEVFVANSGAANVPIFSNLGQTQGNILPSRNIVGSSTNLSNVGVRGIALDTTR